jgi:hypothetical protein
MTLSKVERAVSHEICKTRASSLELQVSNPSLFHQIVELDSSILSLVPVPRTGLQVLEDTNYYLKNRLHQQQMVLTNLTGCFAAK